MAAASSVLPALLLFIAFGAATPGVTAAEETALDQVCSFLGGFYVTPAMCASALCADPSTPCRAARDAPAVAALAARLAAQNATAAKSSVEAALSSRAAAAGGNATSEEEVTKGVRSCLQLYSGMVPGLQWAARSVAAGQYRGAREVLAAAQYVPSGCVGMAGDAAALPKENDGFSNMAIVAHAVLASMLRD